MRHVSRDGAIPIALVLFVILSSQSSVEQELWDQGGGSCLVVTYYWTGGRSGQLLQSEIPLCFLY